MKIGTIVKSISGHDKDSFYVVIRVEAQKAFIADGRRRKVQKPKSKNLKHLRKTNLTVSEHDMETNKNLRRVLWECNFTSYNPVAE